MKIATLLIQVRRSHAGKFNEGVRFQFAGAPHEVILQREIISRIDAVSDLTIARDGTGKFDIEIRDKDLVPGLGKVEPLTPGFTIKHRVKSDRILEVNGTQSLPRRMPDTLRISANFGDAMDAKPAARHADDGAGTDH